MSQRKTQSRLSSAALGGAALLLGSLHASAAFAQTADTGGASASAATAASADPASPASAAAPAAAPAAASPFTANVTLASQYVSRGFRQTWGKPAIQGGFDYTNPNGLFAGTWLSTVSSKFIEGGSVEWDLYGGYGGALGDLSYTGTVYYYVYPGARMSASATNYNYGEFVAALTYKWFTAKYWLTYTPNYFGYDSQSLGVGNGKNSRGSGYLDLNTNIDLTHGFSLLLHYGWERVQNFSAYNWQDAKLAVSKTFDGGWTLTGAVTKAWGATNVYDRYTTGAPDSSGNIAVSNPLQTTFFATITKVF
ncbi:TorF family putative porin [Trinickia diaoshuihuensis]|uniref:TorF family putative porin n=1 Tax=Trinickia diaoshuihuensis TaxID=2292265 RepID=UPI000E233CA7|nr:TorF family putative porin [Trinickia diaoshuihuensis]